MDDILDGGPRSGAATVPGDDVGRAHAPVPAEPPPRGAEAVTDMTSPSTSGDGAGGEGTSDESGDEGGDDEPEHSDAKRRRRPLRSAIEWALVIGGALVVALVIRAFLLQAFWIPTASMVPTLHEGDRVLVNKLSYDLHDVNRGDIIVFERPETDGQDHPEDEIKDLIKRVIGLPGETVEGRGGSLYINGRLLEEPYLPEDVNTQDFPETDIPEGHVFVMGDNRGNSSDSRAFGPVDEDLIVGRAFLRIFPLGDIGGL